MRNLRRVAGWMAAVLLLSSLFPFPASAQGGEGGNWGTKLTRGIVNLTTGWLEIPAQMEEQKRADPTFFLWTVHGLIRGLGIGTARTLYGLWDIITFPVAPYDAPMMEPDTLIKPKDKPRDLEPLPKTSDE